VARVSERCVLSCSDCEFQSKAFQSLTPEQVKKVSDNRSEVAFKQGQLLFKEGMFVSQVFYIRTGFVKIFRESDDELAVMSIAGPGSFVGIQALFGVDAFPFSAMALTDTEACLKEIDVFRSLVLENASFAAEIIEVLGAELNDMYGRLRRYATKDIHTRFARLLIFMRMTMYASNPFQITISRKDMADIIHTSPESISRLISEFRHENVISSNGQNMEILDEHRLAAMASK